jgi:D-sedoheptulose 7-phosphate isomerase
MKQRRFVVLDRDGTIIIERHYLSDPHQVELVSGAAKGLRRMGEMGLGLVVITNQSAIGRGLFDSGQLDLIHQRLCELLEGEGVHLNGIYFCPHIPEDDCSCRKPRTGLLELAAKELDFNPQVCFVIGDKPSDIELGQGVGATTFLVRTGYGAQVADESTATPDYTVDGLWEAAQLIQRILTPEERGAAMKSDVGYSTEVRAHLIESAEVKRQVSETCIDSILAAASLIADTFLSGGKLLLCGNGGSAADCQHMATEFVSQLTKDFERPGLPAIALTTDTSFLTAFSNDRGFEGVFARQVQALGKPGDVLIAISTSGNSVNVIRAVEAAQAANMHTIALTGGGGCLAGIAEIDVSVPSTNTQHIQEAHLTIEHIICGLVELQLFGKEAKLELRVKHNRS